MKRFVRIGAVAALAIGAALSSSRAGVAVAQPSTASVCIDTSSPTADIDRRVALEAARIDGLAPTIYSFDGTYGVSERLFRFLVREHCSLLMGYPVDEKDPDPPRGLALTSNYYRTGYVLASLGRPLTVRTIPANSAVGVGLGTIPNFFLVGALGPAPAFKADAYQSQEEAIAALLAHTDRAAMLWEPSVQRFRARHAGAPPIAITPLHIQHARWSLAALYDPAHSRAVAAHFTSAVARLRANGRLALITNSAASEFSP
jgi:hypothetical protein